MGFFVADFVIFLTLLSNISPAPSLNLFKMFALASFSTFFKACLSPHPFSLPSTLYTRLYLHSLYLLSSHRSFSTRSLLALWKQPPPNIPQKTPPPTPPSVAAVLVMVLNLDVKIREGGFLFDQFLWWFSNKMWQRQGCGERVSGYLSVTFSETNEGRRVPTELWAQMAAVEKYKLHWPHSFYTGLQMHGMVTLAKYKLSVYLYPFSTWCTNKTSKDCKQSSYKL